MQPLPLDLFDFDLPTRHIAQQPARPRDASRLLVVPRRSGAFVHHRFVDLPALLDPGDVLVVNRTQVIPARLGVRRPTGGKVELLFYRPLEGLLQSAKTWEALGRPGSALRQGAALVGPDGACLTVVARHGQMAHVRGDTPLWPLMQKFGQLPLPPYIERDKTNTAEDADDYQSLFAREPGAVAAPTASLHFTERVLAALQGRGVAVLDVVLHVGPGTFLPIRREHADDVRQHTMHEEFYQVPQSTAAAVNAARQAGKRVVAVGTTCLRALETWGQTGALSGGSRLFIYPGYSFAKVSGLVTNFHLPRSTLLLLVAAMAGRERILAAYDAAIAADYRFYSYGDAMLIA